MSKRIRKSKAPFFIKSSAMQLMHRWHLCQRIGTIYYDSKYNYDELFQIMQELEFKLPRF